MIIDQSTEKRMADKRKLQSEIDRCIKRIQEGVEEFDEIWKKVQEATNNNQKEKYETDLKKEIKKLQRLREQIKGWLNSNEIKDKSILQEYRRVIEQKMEQFKVVERETKTKAYSKQGLGAEQKLDPKEKEKEDTIYWLQECIDRLSQQNDKFEAEIEQLSAGAGKKKKLDKDKQERLDELRRHLERHKYHIQKLELLMRLLTNNSLESYQVVKIREDLEYYITSNQDDEFEENDFLYDDLNLGDVEQLAQQMGNIPALGLDESENNSETNTTTSVSPSASPAPSQNSKDSNKDSDDIKLRHVSGEEVIKPLVSRTVPSSLSRSTPTTPLKLTSQLSIDSALSTPPSTGTPPLPASGMSYNSVAAGTKPSTTKAAATIVNRATSSLSFDSKLPPKLDSTSPLSHVMQAAPGGSSMVLSSMMPPPLNAENVTIPIGSSAASAVIGASGASPAPSNNPIGSALSSTPTAAPASSMVPPSPSPLLNAAPQAAQQIVSDLFSSSSISCRSPVLMNGPVEEAKLDDASVMSLKILAEKVASTSSPLPSTSSSVSTATVNSPMTASSNILLNNNMLPGSVGASLLMGLNALNNSNAQQLQHQTQEAKIPPLLGASPLGKIPLTQEHLFQLSTLENAMHHTPMPADSERLRTYLPRSSCQVPPHYPQSPPPMADVLEYFTNLQPETLFFIFYYLEGTKAQYLAAKALKRQSWRFHTKYMMWFQRHEEPKTITEEFEQGTYIYFDFEKWAQRKKEGFTFEYRYLEDKELS